VLYALKCHHLASVGLKGINILCLVFVVLAIISYSIPFYRLTTLRHASHLDSKTFLMEFIEWTIFPTYGGRFFRFFHFWVDLFYHSRLFLVDHFSVDVISMDVFFL